MSTLMTREALHADYIANPEDYIKEAKEERTTVENLLNRKAPEAVNGYPKDALSDI